ncbi:MAG: hypothetical protein WB626_07220 [Bacteroidota bacterium]
MDIAGLRSLIENCASQNGVHVMELHMGGRHRPRIEVFIDAEQGITTDVCSLVSRSIAAALRDHPFPGGGYTLVVSSPGADRPITEPWQFSKHVGRKLSLRVAEAAGEAEISGELLGVGPDGIRFRDEAAGEERTIGFAALFSARVRTPW